MAHRIIPGGGGGGGIQDGASDCLSGVCCDCWTEGCGPMDACFAGTADGLEMLNPIMEYVADLIWCLGSPLAFPLVFCFQAPRPDDMDPPGGGWYLPMIDAPLARPLCCCCGMTLCAPCGQFYLRRRLLDGDMTRYRLWQGMHDGPHCLARRCPGAPITIQSGTYGEQNCPHAFLAAEVCCLGGCWSVCCAFDVNRRLIKQERTYLKDDPTEIRVNKCIGFFSALASKLCMLGCCVCVTSMCIGCCASESEGAQECSAAGQRAGGACRSCARTCWRGIWSVKVIAMGCMSTQMDVELKKGGPPQPKATAPNKKSMDRGLDDNNVLTRDRGTTLDATEQEDDEDTWWKKDGNAY